MFRRSISLLTSMRFAIAMLLLIAIASIIGTILKQSEPYTNYVNRFGEYWSKTFIKLDLHQIYSSWWFLLILFFLVISTCLCIIKTWPKFYKQLKNYQLNIRKEFLLNQKLNYSFTSIVSQKNIYKFLSKKNFKYRVKNYTDNSILIAAKNGKANKYGYLFTHIGIVIICIGGLVDGNLPIKIQQMQGKIVPYNNSSNIIPKTAILEMDNYSFRANLFIPEGEKGDLAIINTTDGILGQKLPFNVELTKFWVDYYSTGMPKKFVSDIIIHDKIDNKTTKAQIEVNKPFSYKGYNFYQSSFEDGGSKLALKIIDTNNSRDENININVGSNKNIKLNNQDYVLNITEFRAINVFNLQDAKNNILNNLHGASFNLKDKKFKNIGPSLKYTLRDNAGQAKEYHIYMLPIKVKEKSTFLVGVRDNNIDEFKYLHIPADENHSINDWVSLAQSLHKAEIRNLAALNYSKLYSSKLQEELFLSSSKALNIFAQSGLIGLSEFIKKTVPAQEQAQASDIILRMLQGSLWELWQIDRKTKNIPQAQRNSINEEFLQRSLIALSDAPLLKTNTWLAITNFNEIKASVLQITKSPGQKIVYLGCLLLVVGVFLMMFIQEKRLWILIEKNNFILGMQMQKQNLYSQQTFKEICNEIQNLK